MVSFSKRTFLALVAIAFLLCASWIVLAGVFVSNPGRTYTFLPWIELPSQDGWKVVRTLRSGPLLPGDRILAIDGDETVRESGSHYKVSRFPNGRQFRLRIQRGAQTSEFTLRRIRGNTVKRPWQYAELLFGAFVFLLTATWIAMQRPDSLQARLAWVAGVVECCLQIAFAVGETGYNNNLPLWFLPPMVVGLAGGLALYLFFESFPAQLPPAPGWTAVRRAVISGSAISAILNAPETLLPFHFPARWAYGLQRFYSGHFLGLGIAKTAIGSLVYLATVAVLIRSYRGVAAPDGKRRIRLVVVTFASLVLWQIIMESLVRIAPSAFLTLNMLQTAPIVLAPLVLAYAIVKHRVLDIRVVVRRTVQYVLARGVLETVVALPFAAVIARAAGNPELPVRQLVNPLPLYVAALSTGIAGLLFRRPLLAALDRRFFREAFGEETVLGELVSAIAMEPTLDSALYLARTEVARSLHPESIEVTCSQAEMPGAPEGGLAIPIASKRGARVGYLLLGPRLSEQSYSAQSRRLLKTLAVQLGLAYDIQALALERVQAVAAERNRMARELHDTFAQGFAGISLHLESARTLIAAAPDTAGDHLQQAHTLARLSLAEARRSVHGLRTGEAGRHDIAYQLRELARLLSTQALRIDVSTRGDVFLPEALSRNVLRIAQESVANAIKHSGGDRIRIELAGEAGRVCLSVSDNGRGFDPSVPVRSGSFGLIGMKERAAEMEAELKFLNNEGGVTVVMTVGTQE
jgi:signal transduction histidine kinase